MNRFIRKLLKKQRFAPGTVVTDNRPSYAAAFRKMNLSNTRDFGGRKNNRAENSHREVRERERQMQRFKWRCQTNLNLTKEDQHLRLLCRTKTSPLCESGLRFSLKFSLL
ncbi:DDE-type integrase/transposase/recombinase [Cohaesibacter celericrescens]|uniref:DDE-type integrase/transposase/recombinase n=1 Tax=Cohaesibacter celericrescens TaxID=2067669 RepID=UPI003CC9F583